MSEAATPRAHWRIEADYRYEMVMAMAAVRLKNPEKARGHTSNALALLDEMEAAR